MPRIVFVHGMFQNPKSWEKWVAYVTSKGHECIAPAWPLHEGEPRALRENPPEGLGDLKLSDVISVIERVVSAESEKPILVGHSVGGLITQILLNRGLIAAGIAIDSVAPNAMVDLDWGFIKNSTVIANPLKGNEPILMDAKTFHGSFANTLTEEQAAREFETTATHDSRNVLRGCMGPDGKVDVDAAHGPLLLIGGEEDQIVPAHLTEKNFKAYADRNSVTEFQSFQGRSHYICNEPGWQEVADVVLSFIERNASLIV
ncbi:MULTISPECIES: alpha/beta hydrolase [unclassified Caballeronia]|uniref:alpha/beta hydrolase n=1 Tax=unclassified Caballeronia TaxID=2646786 RepID=UPI002027CDCB|nr:MULTISPECIES: alpha/beta hydrolase [unclassified Caballeronia]MDR5777612.1 alpha/beta hydrolase [Caballeronia sp. LZ002]MDR5798646.1 alpha/beta hydrolase [Caballeronia sp. LZ001]MDR5853057.1 alpha/beta hydrolase [Caballeronia sp. LZ003]